MELALHTPSDDLSVGRMMAEEAGSDCTPYMAGLGLIGGTIALGGLIALCTAFVAWLRKLPLVLRWSYATRYQIRTKQGGGIFSSCTEWCRKRPPASPGLFMPGGLKVKKNARIPEFSVNTNYLHRFCRRGRDVKLQLQLFEIRHDGNLDCTSYLGGTCEPTYDNATGTATWSNVTVDKTGPFMLRVTEKGGNRRKDELVSDPFVVVDQPAIVIQFDRVHAVPHKAYVYAPMEKIVVKVSRNDDKGHLTTWEPGDGEEGKLKLRCSLRDAEGREVVDTADSTGPVLAGKTVAVVRDGRAEWSGLYVKEPSRVPAGAARGGYQLCVHASDKPDSDDGTPVQIEALQPTALEVPDVERLTPNEITAYYQDTESHDLDRERPLASGIFHVEPLKLRPRWVTRGPRSEPPPVANEALAPFAAELLDPSGNVYTNPLGLITLHVKVLNGLGKKAQRQHASGDMLSVIMDRTRAVWSDEPASRTGTCGTWSDVRIKEGSDDHHGHFKLVAYASPEPPQHVEVSDLFSDELTVKVGQPPGKETVLVPAWGPKSPDGWDKRVKVDGKWTPGMFTGVNFESFSVKLYEERNGQVTYKDEDVYKRKDLTLSVSLFDDRGVDMRAMGTDDDAEKRELIPRLFSYTDPNAHDEYEWGSEDGSKNIRVRHRRLAAKGSKDEIQNGGKYTLCIRCAECPTGVYVRELISTALTSERRILNVDQLHLRLQWGPPEPLTRTAHRSSQCARRARCNTAADILAAVCAPVPQVGAQAPLARRDRQGGDGLAGGARPQHGLRAQAARGVLGARAAARRSPLPVGVQWPALAAPRADGLRRQPPRTVRRRHRPPPEADDQPAAQLVRWRRP